LNGSDRYVAAIEYKKKPFVPDKLMQFLGAKLVKTVHAAAA